MDLPGKNKNRENLVSVGTDHLKERLNRLYDAVRGSSQTYSHWGRLDYLWDLKEVAMMEGRKSVDIPDSWLDELERLYVEVGDFSGRSH
jgi:hypothetical protein